MMEQENKPEESNDSEGMVREAQVVFEEENKEETQPEQADEEVAQIKRKRTKTDYYIEIALFLVLGVLVGIAVKNEAVKKITIGYDDYMMDIKSQEYDLNKIQSDLLKKKLEEQQAQQDQLEQQNKADSGGDEVPAGNGSQNESE